MKLNMESIADRFSEEFNRGLSISRCDFLEITDEYVIFMEKTDLRLRIY